ncbi:DGQHR domain-containing protein [Terribacillus saccharophilus]|uniref:DGQHR domain-containing protein n=1 Tax=Terribacillus saccharophilus TaxID=361277 RepID=UPI0014759EDD|nr:DGQHR domain-containing protein [Terribacillus goriensis]
MIQADYIPLNQKEIQLYLVKLTVEEIINNSIVSVFNSSTGEGYQRPPIPSHYKKIAQYLEKEDRVLLPIGVLTATDPNKVNIVNGRLQINGPLRIVDGQHRIEGFKYLSANNSIRYEQFRSFELPVTIMVIDEEHEVDEMDTFININSKAKKINTNLAIGLRHERRKEEQYKRSFDEIVEDIAISVTKLLDNDLKSIWYNAITIAPDEKGKIISLNAFRKSLIPLIELFIRFYKDPKDVEDAFFVSGGEELQPVELNDELIPVLEEFEEKYITLIKLYLDSTWKVIWNKWNSCFNLYQPYFDRDYNIQKGIGLYSLHLVLQDCLKREENVQSALFQFKKIIENTTVDVEDWESGGTFSGNNSQSGFRIIADRINEGKLI